MKSSLCILLLSLTTIFASPQGINFGDSNGGSSSSNDDVNSRLGLVASSLGNHPLGQGSSSSSSSHSGGLLANSEGQHPLGGSGNSHSASLIEEQAEGRNRQYCCCAQRNRQCPARGEFDDDDYYYGEDDYDYKEDYGDYGDGEGLNPRAQLDKNKNKNTNLPDIGTRIVNNPPRGSGNNNNNGNVGDCPRNRDKCCYRSRSYMLGLGDRCRPINGGGSNSGGSGSGSGGNWRTLCNEKRPGSFRGKRCGERNFRHISGLKQGESSPGEFPWTCLVLDGRNNFVGTCAIVPDSPDNSLSNGRVKIITAAHKLAKIGRNDELKVRVGEYDASEFNSNIERIRHQEYIVRRIVKHPEFNPKRLTNDIAVLHLDLGNRGFDLNANNVNAACIPNCDDMFNFQFRNGTGTRCWVAGWGKDGINGRFQVIQHKVDVPIYDYGQCESSIKDALRKQGSRNTANTLRMHPGEICAGGETGKDACDGDGGAPLVCQAPSGRWYVVGLVAWGVDCALTDVPGVYARVSYYKDFIDRA